MESKLWSVLNSKSALLVVALLVTTVVGAWLGDRFREKAWRRQVAFEADRRSFEWEREKNFELLRQRLGEGPETIEKISEAMNRRLLKMERALDTLIRSNGRVGTDLWSEYLKAVDEWNINVKYYEEDLRRLVGEEFAWELNNYETDQGCPREPRSIQGKFFCGHRSLVAVRQCGGCRNRRELSGQTANYIRELNFQTHAFVARAGDVFLDRFSELDEFKLRDESTEEPPNTAIEPTGPPSAHLDRSAPMNHRES